MDLRIFLIIGILAFSLAGLANAVYFGLELKRYAQRTNILDSPLSLFRFKKIVANQMYGALAQIGLLIAPPILFGVGILLNVLHGSDIFYVIVPAVLILVVAAVFRSWEKVAQTIPTSDEEIQAQRDAIIRTWLKKPWPDW